MSLFLRPWRLHGAALLAIAALAPGILHAGDKCAALLSAVVPSSVPQGGIVRGKLEEIIELLDRMSKRTFEARTRGRRAREAALLAKESEERIS